MSKIQVCRGCGNSPVIFENDDYHPRSYFGCVNSEEYLPDYKRDNMEECKPGCRLNAVDVGDHGGDISILFEKWNKKQSKDGEISDENECLRIKALMAEDSAEKEGTLTDFTARTLGRFMIDRMILSRLKKKG